MAAEWFLQIDGKTVGPVSASELKQRADQGVIADRTLVKKEKDGKWMEAWRVKGLMNRAKPNDREQRASDEIEEIALAELGEYTRPTHHESRTKDNFEPSGIQPIVSQADTAIVGTSPDYQKASLITVLVVTICPILAFIICFNFGGPDLRELAVTIGRYCLVALFAVAGTATAILTLICTFSLFGKDDQAAGGIFLFGTIASGVCLLIAACLCLVNEVDLSPSNDKSSFPGPTVSTTSKGDKITEGDVKYMGRQKLKAALKDPGSLEIISEEVVTSYVGGVRYVEYLAQYRAKNSFGAYDMDTFVYTWKDQ